MSDIKTWIVNEAKRIVSGARRKSYGKPESNFERIALFWNAYLINTGRQGNLTAADISPLMRLMKEARLCESPGHLDSFVDLVGYTLTGAEVNGVTIPGPPPELTPPSPDKRSGSPHRLAEFLSPSE